MYRFRPRRNDAINGFFICDAGRLSYKELQENRQEHATLKGRELSKEEALKEFRELLALHQNSIAVVIDANLYTEEIESIINFAQKIDAKIYAPLDIYKDASFADDMLKSSMRAANYKTIKNLGLETSEPSDANLIINCNHPEDFSAHSKVNFLTHTREDSALTLPIAAYTESAGTLTNEDNITQYSKQTVFKNTPLPTISEYLEGLGYE